MHKSHWWAVESNIMQCICNERGGHYNLRSVTKGDNFQLPVKNIKNIQKLTKMGLLKRVLQLTITLHWLITISTCWPQPALLTGWQFYRRGHPPFQLLELLGDTLETPSTHHRERLEIPSSTPKTPRHPKRHPIYRHPRIIQYSLGTGSWGRARDLWG